MFLPITLNCLYLQNNLNSQQMHGSNEIFLQLVNITGAINALTEWIVLPKPTICILITVVHLHSTQYYYFSLFI